MSAPSNPASPWVIVDDFDPSIAYEGPWIWSEVVGITDLSQETAYNNTGHAILPTISGLEQSGSFSMVFEGTDIAVYGNSTIGNNTVPVSSSSSVNILPTWSCSIDGGPISSHNPFGSFPYTSFCSATDLAPDTPHTLNVTVNGSGIYGFSMDFVRYKPSTAALAAGTVDATPPAKPLTAGALGKTAWVGAGDAGISYAPGWADLASGKVIFDVTGPSTGAPAVTIGFTGSSLTWHALSKEVVWSQMKDSTPSLSTAFNSLINGVYVLDGHGAQGAAEDGVDTVYPFGMNLSSPALQIESRGNPYNEVVFRTPQLLAGQHVLRLWLNATDWPLTLDYLTIENGFASESDVSTTSSGPTGTGRASGRSKGALIGGAVGGVIGGLLLIVFALFLVRQRSMMRRKQRSSNMTRRWTNTDIKLRPVSSPIREGVAPAVQSNDFVNDGQREYAFAFDSKNGRF